MNENQIIDAALERFTGQTGLKAKWKPRHDVLDGEADFYLQKGRLHVYLEAKQELRPHQLNQIFELAKRHQPFMVVAETIFPTMKKLLREKKIGYLDTAGNIYLNAANNFIWIEGNKPDKKKKKVISNRAFTKTGLKMVFYLLLNDQAINLPYRKLANAAGIALGNIKFILEGLQDAGFILRINNNTLKLQQKELLLERWLTGFRETLRPALHLGTYKFWDKNRLGNWQALPLEPAETKWGGEPAAELLTNHLVPTHLTVYTNNHFPLVGKWTLVPDEKGNVHFYEKFWNDARYDEKQYVPPLLVYADLVLTDDPRCQETAGIIYNKYLKNEFK